MRKFLLNLSLCFFSCVPSSAITINDLSDVIEANLRLQRDDRSIVYLNGVEVMCSNMPNAPVPLIDFKSLLIWAGTFDNQLEESTDLSN